MLQAGLKLGPYEIVEFVGAGGMGEVYRARDTRLGREVAIKVLPPQFSSDSELKERFEREARTISSLSHPNICTLYDVGHSNGIDYLVLEFLQGESLARRLEKGALPIREVLRHGPRIKAISPRHGWGFGSASTSPFSALGLRVAGRSIADTRTTAPRQARRGGMIPGEIGWEVR